MSLENISTGVASMETQAEKILEEARKQAAEILRKTREEIKAIASEDLPLEEIEKTGEKAILSRAREEANRITTEANKSISEINSTAKQKSDKIISSIITTITGD
jgi:vacuolar-type H+-ATPase subunit H